MVLMPILALASPILYESSHLIWILDVVASFAATVVVVLTHANELLKFAPFTLIPAILFTFVILMFAQTPVVPWVTFGIAAFLLITTFCLPEIDNFFHVVPQRPQDEFEDGLHDRSSFRSEIEHSSVQSLDLLRRQAEFPRPLPDIGHDISHMERIPYSLSRTDIPSGSGSEISITQDAETGRLAIERFFNASHADLPRIFQTVAGISNQDHGLSPDIREHISQRDIPRRSSSPTESSMASMPASTKPMLP